MYAARRPYRFPSDRTPDVVHRLWTILYALSQDTAILATTMLFVPSHTQWQIYALYGDNPKAM